MSAWEQWEGKKPASKGLQSAQDVFNRIVQSSSLSLVSTDSTEREGSTTLSLKKAWESAREFTKNVVPMPVVSKDTTAIIETKIEIVKDEKASILPVWGKDISSQSTLNLSMNWNTRFRYFVGMAMLGTLFFGMASLFLPLIMLRPSKFALSFTLGSICCMGAFAMLKGPATYVSELLHPNRVLLTSAYFVTLGCTLYSCLILGNYVFVVLSSVLQLMTLGSFALSAFPRGNVSLKAFGAMFWKAARRMLQVMARLFR